MRIYLIILIVITSFRSFAQDANIDVLHYRFDVNFTDSSDQVRGVANIRFKALAPISETNFQLINLDRNKKGMRVMFVFSDKRPLKFDHKDNKVLITLASELKKNEEKEIQIHYAGVPADGLIIAKNKYGKRTFFSDNWPDRAHNWLPCKDQPGDKASVEFLVTAPMHYQVISNGVQIEETNLDNNRKFTHWKEEIPLPTKIMVVGAADFAVHLAGTVDHVPVTSWVYPEDREKGFHDYALATGILSWFNKQIAPYAYQKLANIQSKTIFGGMENASAIFYSENSITGNRSSEGLIAHEIAHQWFGNMATEKTFAHLWLSEGFATYLTILYMRDKYGEDTARKMRAEDRQQVIEYAGKVNKAVVDTSTTDYMQLLNANSYQKGGWVLHMLHRMLGEEKFWKGIREYYNTYAGRNADTDDFRRVMEKVSGKNLESFFRQWLYTPGVPKLDIEWKYNASTKKMVITVTQKQAALASFPLEVLWESGSQARTITLEITKQTQTWQIPVPAKSSNFVVDPGIGLLFEGKVTGK